MNINGNTILITGGTSGIGFELAKQLIALDNTVIVTGRDEKRLQAAASKLPKLETIESDVSSAEAIQTLHRVVLEKFPKLNMIVNNAGIMRKINLHDTTDLVDLTSEVETNLSGSMRMVAQFLPHLKAQKNAAIMNVSSGLAFVPLPISPIYCATKAALHSYSLALRVQLKNTNVRVFELAPPLTETGLLQGFDPADMEGTKVMPVTELVAHTIEGMKNDRFEIRPGSANLLYWMARIAPRFILGQLGKPTDKMVAAGKNAPALTSKS